MAKVQNVQNYSRFQAKEFEVTLVMRVDNGFMSTGNCGVKT